METIVAKDLFVEAMRISPEQRAAWLAELSYEARGSVEPLLEADALLTPEVAAGSSEERFARASSLVADSLSQQSSVPGTQEVNARQARAATDCPVQIGKYRIIKKLGQGAQGSVFRGVHPTLNRDVAIKLSRTPFDPSLREGLQTEAELLCQLSHPGLAQVYDLDFEDGYPYLVMEYIPGQSLEQLAASGRLTAEQSASLVCKLCDALDYVHSQGVVHQDLKPDNIVLDDRMEPRIIDFGLAHMRSAWIDNDSQMVGGTLAYMSPEQATGFRLPEDPPSMVPPAIDHRADIFALGAILYRLLTGQRLYEAADRNDGLRVVRDCRWDAERLRGTGISTKLANACTRALASKASDRPATCRELADAMQPSPQGVARNILRPLALGSLLIGVWVGLNLLTRDVNPPAGSDDPEKSRSVPTATDAQTADTGEADAARQAGELFDKDAPPQSVSREAPGEITPSPSALDVQITHFGNEGEDQRFERPLGAGARPVREQDQLRFDIRLAQPAYCMLMAFNPDGTIELCCPDDPDHVATEVMNELHFPPETDLGFIFSEGPGQQAFVLLQADQPLPSYNEWLNRRVSIHWPDNDVSGTWVYQDSQIKTGKPDLRGKPVPLKGSAGFRKLCEQLESASPGTTVYGLSFPVAPLNNP